MADTALTVPRVTLGAVPLRMAGDDRLADLAAAGDERAFSVMFERHHQALYRYCRSILGNDEDAADALQNTMLRALRALPGEKRTIALKPWLFRIAHNEAITVVRRRRPEADVTDEALGLQSVAPEVGSDTRERVHRLFEDLRELPERQRSALIMRELGGLSYDEIAAALHTSTGAATQAVFGARKALHEFAAGRDTLCEDIRREISRRDGRILASRRIRSHLRNCADCSAFRAMMVERERHFAVMAPPFPALAAAAMLQGLQGGGGLGGGLSGLGGLAGAAGSGHAVISAAVLKATPMILAAAVGAGSGAIVGGPDPARVTPHDEPAAALRALAERAGREAHAAAAAVALRAGVDASPAARQIGNAGPPRETDAGIGPPLAAPGAPATDRGAVGPPEADRPTSGAPSPQQPAPTGERTPAAAPKPAPETAPQPPSSSPTATPPAKAPASEAPAPAPGPPVADDPDPVTAPEGPPDTKPGKPRKPRPCRPQPPPRGHPDGPCPT